jgi:hypothetical protein
MRRNRCRYGDQIDFEFERIKPIPSHGQGWCEGEREGSWQTVGEEGEGERGDQQPTPRTRRPSYVSPHESNAPAKWSDDRYRRSELDSVLSAKVSSFEHEQLTMLISDPIHLCGSLERFKTQS